MSSDSRLLLMVARRTGEGEREVHARRWTSWRPTHLLGSAVTGKTIGILGMGRNGAAVARRAHFGFGRPVVFYDKENVIGHGYRTPSSSARPRRCSRQRTSCRCICPAAGATTT